MYIEKSVRNEIKRFASQLSHLSFKFKTPFFSFQIGYVPNTTKYIYNE